MRVTHQTCVFWLPGTKFLRTRRAGYRVFGTLLQLKVINIFKDQYVNVEERIPGQPRTVFFSALKTF